MAFHLHHDEQPPQTLPLPQAAALEPPPATPAKVPPPQAKQQPATGQQPAPYNGNFAATPPVTAPIPHDAFNTAPRAATADDTVPQADIRDFKSSLRKFGLPTGPGNGAIDAATWKSFRLLTLISGMPVTNVPTAQAALRSAEDRAARMLWVLNLFPFGTSLPSWLLASLDNDDITTITDAFNQRAREGTQTFSIKTGNGLTIHGRLIAEGDHSGCFGFSALFERGPLQHHVISRACRISADQWALAERN